MNKLNFLSLIFLIGSGIFSIIWQEGTALKYSISERLLIIIAVEICIGVTYRMIPVNLLFYISTPRIISKLFPHTTNLRKRGERKESSGLSPDFTPVE